MITNGSITIYHKEFYSDSKTTKYKRCQVSDAHWHHKHIMQPTTNGVVRADVIKIRIPLDASNIPEIEKGDYVVRGALDMDIESRNDLTGYEFGIVADISINTDGLNPHIRIGADG